MINEKQTNNSFDPLDMHNYRIEKLPKRSKSSVERILSNMGGPLAIISFVLIYFIFKPGYLLFINPESLGEHARTIFDQIGSQEFSRINIAMLAIFVFGIVLWMTEAIPNYLTSLFIIIGLVLTGVLSEKEAYAQLGHKVMWLNIMSFVLASMLVKTGLAKRFALWFIVHFGKRSSSIFLSFLLINVVLSAFISATTAKAAILLPIFMVIAAIYGARGGDKARCPLYPAVYLPAFRHSDNHLLCAGLLSYQKSYSSDKFTGGENGEGAERRLGCSCRNRQKRGNR